MIDLIDLGRISFDGAWEIQKRLTAARQRGEGRDTLLLLEHPPVITFGRRAIAEDLLAPEELLKERGIELKKTDRGGRITYHGPGQLVAYFIFKLERETVPGFVAKIEEVVLNLLASWKIRGERDPRYPGVWIGGNKIAAIGLHFEKRVSRHGCALNVSCDLEPFSLIQPCGIQGRGVTSIAKEMKNPPTMEEVKMQFAGSVESVFKRSINLRDLLSIPPG